jgi:Xaa-Pro aminopeptidase
VSNDGQGRSGISNGDRAQASHVAQKMRNRENHSRVLELAAGMTHATQLGVDVPARIDAIDQVALRRYRLDRVREQLRSRDVAGALLSDAMNIRYATGTRNMVLWTLRQAGRYAFIATEGPVVMFEFSTCRHLAEGFETVDEIRTGTSTFYFYAGSRTLEKTRSWAQEIDALLREYGGRNRRLAVDDLTPLGAAELARLGVEFVDGHEAMEQARCIKSREEIAAHQLAMDVCDLGIERLRDGLRPGLTENQIWSVLQATNIAHDGEFIDCRLLTSGSRTIPWFQECNNRQVCAGELVAFDTDMVGPMGVLADISRSYVVPGRAATGAQRELYALAEEQVAHNMALLRPGVSFHDFADRSWRVPARFEKNRYMTLVHGVGLCDEWPAVLPASDQRRDGYDGVFQENMIVSVESYLGADDGHEGVKLEQQVLITASGVELFSRIPIAAALEIA